MDSSYQRASERCRTSCNRSFDEQSYWHYNWGSGTSNHHSVVLVADFAGCFAAVVIAVDFVVAASFAVLPAAAFEFPPFAFVSSVPVLASACLAVVELAQAHWV